jgi:protein involved in sex pheromone biosynthesis
MNSENERKQTQEALMRNAFDTTYYELQAFRKSKEDYSPYSYLLEDGEDLVFFDEKTLEE